MTTIAIAIVGRAVTLGRAINKRSKELIPKMKQRRTKAIPLQESIEKSPILPFQYSKERKIDVTIIISHFMQWYLSPTVQRGDRQKSLHFCEIAIPSTKK